jgi:hypothetical protein
MDKSEIEGIAKELIAEIAAEWEDTQTAYKSEDDGIVVFTFVTNTDYGASTFNYNPLAHAVQVVESFEDDLAKLRDGVKATILGLVNNAGGFFSDALSSLPYAAPLDSMRREFGTEFHNNFQRNFARFTFGVLEKQLKQRLNLDTNATTKIIKNRRAFDDNEALNAILDLAPNPTIYGVAKKLGKTRGAVRNWLESKGCKKPNEVVEMIKKKKSTSDMAT